jgi:hypothetical protein
MNSLSMLPPLTANEYQHLAELFKPEEEYYRVYSPQPHTPPKGVFLLIREPFDSTLKVCYPSGDYKTFQYSKELHQSLIKCGLPEDRIEKCLDYVWNFGKVYVKASNPELFAPELITMD